MAGTSDATRRNDPEHAEVLVQLIQREPIFHRPELGILRADFEGMTEPDFWEVGASGSLYNREHVLNELERRMAKPHSDVWETSEFRCRRLAEGLYLLSYTLLQDRVRLTRRTTIWRLAEDGWKIVFHQGTLVQEP
jgi:hypothetical protein